MELYLPYSFAGLSWIESLACARRGAPRLLWDGVTDMGVSCPSIYREESFPAIHWGDGLIRVAEAAMQIQARPATPGPDVKNGLATGFGGCFWSDIMVMERKRNRTLGVCSF